MSERYSRFRYNFLYFDFVKQKHVCFQEQLISDIFAKRFEGVESQNRPLKRTDKQSLSCFGHLQQRYNNHTVDRQFLVSNVI